MNNRRHVHAVEWHSEQLVLLDQRKLPNEECYVRCQSLNDVISAIQNMTVRGAPAIGITAAYGVVLWLTELCQHSNELPAYQVIHSGLERLKAARPTAVNLSWAVNQAQACIVQHKGSNKELISSLLALATKIHQQDIEANQLMAETACDYMAELNPTIFSILTHCNAGSLATGGYGTALGVVRSAWKRGLIDRVYADETRPWLQGARLTAWELNYEDIPVTLNIDSSAAWLMANRPIKWVVVGADRIAANGDVANKIGTYQLAIAANYHDVRVMVVAPSSTVDLSIERGDEIAIEMRSGKELTETNGMLSAPDDIDVVNPVFDVTPASLIDVIVTEKGLIERPTRQKMLWTLA